MKATAKKAEVAQSTEQLYSLCSGLKNNDSQMVIQNFRVRNSPILAQVCSWQCCACEAAESDV